jgi:hypothetical protein
MGDPRWRATALVACAAGCGGVRGSSGGETSDATVDEGDDDDVHFDVESSDAMGGCDGDGSGGDGELEYDFVNLWVANSPEGTVSKIDTRARAEVARYRAGAGEPDPSRTSVNRLGDMVVVNRGGSITKILGRPDACPDLDDDGQVQTSSGAGDVLAWGEDECVAWHRELTDTTGTQNAWGPRPVAWEGSEMDCAARPRVWVGWYDAPHDRGQFRRLDGLTGAVEDEVEVPWPSSAWGPYGGAVDQAGDFWVIGWQIGPLVRIDEDGTTFDVYEIPPHPSGEVWTYGIALDPEGRPWISSAGAMLRFDPAIEEFLAIDTGNVMMRGVAADRVGNVWAAVEEDAYDDCALAVVDYEHEQLLAPSIKLLGCSEPVGVGVDADGLVWVVDQGSELAFRVDPDTYEAEVAVTGLVLPYTYSDMTGAGLNLVYDPPEP